MLTQLLLSSDSAVLTKSKRKVKAYVLLEEKMSAKNDEICMYLAPSYVAPLSTTPVKSYLNGHIHPFFINNPFLTLAPKIV